MASGRVLVVEDDRRTATILQRYLERAGYSVTLASTGDDGVAAFEREAPDLAILDVMLPGRDGLDVCRHIRARGDTPVVMLTARVDESDRLRGLFGGADDYVVKPFSPREVVARVQAVLRRCARSGLRPPLTTQFGNLELDPLACDARVDGRSIDLTPTEYRLLDALCSTPGAPWSRARLIERVFGWDYDGSERTVDTHVANLRKKLSACGTGVPQVVTAFGRGYALARPKSEL
jgi:two-component system response regulator BaeR